MFYPDEIGNEPEEYRPLLQDFGVVPENRAAWKDAAKFYWVAAHKAQSAHDFRLMREASKQAEAADKTATAGSVLLTAIFGGQVSQPADNIVRIGRTISDADEEAAKAAVQGEISRHSASVAKKAADGKAEYRAEIAQQKADSLAAKVADADSKISVGQIYEATVSYKNFKKTLGNVCEVDGVIVYCQDFGRDARKVRITSIAPTTVWGVKCMATGEAL